MSIDEKLIEVRRAGFEAWQMAALAGDGYSPDYVRWTMERRHDGVYSSTYVNGAWIGYNAALDSVVVELPKPHYEFDGDPAPEMMASEIIKAIHAAGVRTK